GVGPWLVQAIVQDPDRLAALGRIYGSILPLQLAADVFIGVLLLLLLIWPQGGAVAPSALLESIPPPTYWPPCAGAAFVMAFTPVIPYFTSGEDYKMVQALGYDTIMLVSALFGPLAASMSISEEIEGRTAITLMSKPVSRRQFLLGKFIGIFLACLVRVTLLGWWFNWLLPWKRR